MKHIDDDGIHPWDVMAKDDDKIWQHKQRLKGISRAEVPLKPSPTVQPHYPCMGKG